MSEEVQKSVYGLETDEQLVDLYLVTDKEASRLADELRLERDASGHSDIDILGPTPAYPPRLRGHYRWQVILRGSDPRALLDAVPIPPTWTTDIDPVSLT